MAVRIDLYLVQMKNVESRERAQELIRSGFVTVNGVVCKKNSTSVDDSDSICITDSLKYVGRGGYKLEKALDFFKISLVGRKILDVGASTGGFTDCALQRGAISSVAVDVGHGQLSPILCSDSRVTNLEGVHIKDISLYYSQIPDFICVDVSFYSLTNVLPYLIPFAENADIIALVKPQFEVRHRKSVIRDVKVHREVLSKILSVSRELGFSVQGLTYSPIRGTEGNIEYLLYLRRHGTDIPVDISAVVRSAFNFL